MSKVSRAVSIPAKRIIHLQMIADLSLETRALKLRMDNGQALILLILAVG